MKTKINKMKAMVGLFTLLTVTVVFSIAAAPAMAGPVHLDGSLLSDVLGAPAQLDRVHEVLDSLLLTDLLPGIADDLRPEGPFPDGGGWEPVFPEDAADDAADDAPADEADEPGDEAADEPADEAADDGGDDGGDEAADEPAEEAGDEVVDEPADEAVEEEPLEEEPEDGEEAAELPYTGGDSIPWLIGGAGVILAGIILAFGLGRRNSNADR